MMEEKKYPIYKFSARWNQDDYQNNGSSVSFMFKDDDIKEVTKQLNRWWHNMLYSKSHTDGIAIIKKHPKLLNLTAEFYEYNTWCLRWFSHITFNQFDNEHDIIASFRRFVDEKMPLNQNLEYSPEFRKKEGLQTYCLMGAEDEWRWKICGCDQCKKEGIIAITH